MSRTTARPAWVRSGSAPRLRNNSVSTSSSPSSTSSTLTALRVVDHPQVRVRRRAPHAAAAGAGRGALAALVEGFFHGAVVGPVHAVWRARAGEAGDARRAVAARLQLRGAGLADGRVDAAAVVVPEVVDAGFGGEPIKVAEVVRRLGEPQERLGAGDEEQHATPRRHRPPTNGDVDTHAHVLRPNLSKVGLTHMLLVF